ncbi:FAS1 domain-containing protein [Chytriomyces cf. hyalinus JEL632]|nr:FAS1 domain-containing protein [Chytriomyces cf. hyalinus JEL632]
MKFIPLALAFAHAIHAQSLAEALTQAKVSTLASLLASDTAVQTALAGFKGTIFAPSDAALAATVTAGFNPADMTMLTTVLTYHAVPNTVFPSATQATGDDYLLTAQGSEIMTTFNSTGVYLTTGATKVAMVNGTFPFEGGLVHVVDTTLIPPSSVVILAKTAGLTQFVDAVVAAGLADAVATLKNATILAPTNEAFAAIAEIAKTLTKEQLQQVLLAHVIPGGFAHAAEIAAAKELSSVPTSNAAASLDVKYDGTTVLVSVVGVSGAVPSKVVKADILADNILVHVIDRVLVPNFSAGAPAAGTAVAGSPAASGTARAAATGTATTAATAAATTKASAGVAAIVSYLAAALAFGLSL